MIKKMIAGWSSNADCGTAGTGSGVQLHEWHGVTVTPLAAHRQRYQDHSQDAGDGQAEVVFRHGQILRARFFALSRFNAL